MGFSAPRRFFFQGVDERRAVDRFDDVEERRRRPRLVRLQLADQVQDRSRWQRCGELALRVLDAVLPEMAQRPAQTPHRRRSIDRLRDGDDGDLVGAAGRPRRRPRRRRPRARSSTASRQRLRSTADTRTRCCRFTSWILTIERDHRAEATRCRALTAVGEPFAPRRSGCRRRTDLDVVRRHSGAIEQVAIRRGERKPVVCHPWAAARRRGVRSGAVLPGVGHVVALPRSSRRRSPGPGRRARPRTANRRRSCIPGSVRPTTSSTVPRQPAWSHGDDGAAAGTGRDRRRGVAGSRRAGSSGPGPARWWRARRRGRSASIRVGAPARVPGRDQVDLRAVDLTEGDEARRGQPGGVAPLLAHLPGVRLVTRGAVAKIAVRLPQAGHASRDAVRRHRAETPAALCAERSTSVARRRLLMGRSIARAASKII